MCVRRKIHLPLTSPRPWGPHILVVCHDAHPLDGRNRGSNQLPHRPFWTIQAHVVSLTRKLDLSTLNMLDYEKQVLKRSTPRQLPAFSRFTASNMHCVAPILILKGRGPGLIDFQKASIAQHFQNEKALFRLRRGCKEVWD